jgi:uncharacterized protein with von Willebrand factor type A (vWA) domain
VNAFLSNCLLFVNMLRRAGIAISTEQSLDFVQALNLIDMSQREQVYYAARTLLISRYEHLRLFDSLFNRFWNKQFIRENGQRQTMPHAPRHDRLHHRPLLISYMASKAKDEDPEIDVSDKSSTFSHAELLQQKDFSQLNAEELQAVKRLIEAIRWQFSQRQTRRYIPDKTGAKLQMRRILRSATKHGGVPIQLSYQGRKIKQRPIILLADISGSMEKYSRLVLQFFYSVSQSLKNVECFVFGTRLSRITAQLKLKNIDKAIEQAAHTVVDWSGGTRIGESLHQFNKHWARRVLRRGAIVIIVSDGWERGNSEMLKKEMRVLSLRAYRLIWLNPHSAQIGYQASVGGMAAAMPYIDDFLPIDNFQSLKNLSAHLNKLNYYTKNV